MKGTELIAEICGDVRVPENTCDILLNAECDRELSRVAVSMFATVDVLRRAKDWGADLLIVHEPTLLQREAAVASSAKAELVRSVGFPIWRGHDHAHASDPDLITEGGLRALGLHGTLEKTQYYAFYLFRSDRPVSARELTAVMRERLGLMHLRVAGELDHPTVHIIRSAPRSAFCRSWSWSTRSKQRLMR